jgi:hypothetical protein
VGAALDADRGLAGSAELIELAPIETTLKGEAGALVPVTLRSRVTELGTLELLAVERGGVEHSLSFQIRES